MRGWRVLILRGVACVVGAGVEPAHDRVCAAALALSYPTATTTYQSQAFDMLSPPLKQRDTATRGKKLIRHARHAQESPTFHH